jgi:hypothetical protein
VLLVVCDVPVDSEARACIHRDECVCVVSVSDVLCNSQKKLISWNVRGLNAAARSLAVHETIAATPCQLVCLQETKLQTIDQSLAAFLGSYKLNSFAFKLSVGTKGGILLLWNDSEVEVS